MNGIPQSIADLLNDINATRDDVWEVRRGTWVVKHKTLERIAVHLDIKFDSPKIIHADMDSKQAAIEVSRRIGENTAWSIGEAAPYNNKNAYPFAMAEKRAKDRVILKLAGIHGDAYSEEEADDFKHPSSKEDDPQMDALLAHNEALRNNLVSIYFIKEYINMDSPKWENVAEAWAEISNEDKKALWLAPSKGGVFTTAERAALKSDEFNAARKVIGE